MPPSRSGARNRSLACPAARVLLASAFAAAGATPAAASAVPATHGASAVPAAPAASAEGPRPAPLDHLVIAYDDGSGSTATFILSCRPHGGTHPAPSAACRRLERLGGPLGPVPGSRMCTQFYGGPQTARIVGVWHGRRVDQTYRHSNGCEVDRWQSMEPVLPDTAAH